MSTRLSIGTAILAILVAPAAMAQLIGFPSCSGQPVITGDQTGTVEVGAYATFVPYSDTIDTTAGNGCVGVPDLADSVVCFEPADPCTVTVRFVTPAGTSSGLNLVSGCDTMPASCLDGEEGDGGQLGFDAALDASLYCFVGSADGAPVGARFEFDNLAACGTLAGGGGGGGGGGGAVEHRYFIPAAARASGFGTSFFVTDVEIHNADNDEAAFRLLWLPRDTNNASPDESIEFVLGPGASIRFKDVLAEVFNVGAGANAVGALAVVSDTSDLLLMSRTFNVSDEGTFGQSIVGIDEDDLIQAGERRRGLFLTENDGFRSNLGLLNGTDAPITVKWRRFRSNGSPIDIGETQLPPWGNTQLNRVFDDQAPIEAAYVIVWTDTVGGAFAVYGSVLDESTSDPTTVPGQ
jgi:hypothetical protein